MKLDSRPPFTRVSTRLVRTWLLSGCALASVYALACSSSGSSEDPAPAAAPNGVDSSDQTPTDTVQKDPPVVADAATTLPFDMRTWQPSAKGLWIWYLDYVGMTAAEAATKAKELGVGYVLIKSSQDKAFWADRFNATIVKEFTSRNIRALAWPYITPAGGSAAIDAAVQAAKVPGCDGLVLDVEIEWEKNGDHAAEAETLCQGIRAKAPGVWLGYTAFGWVSYHPGFPWTAFDQNCGDAYFPQVYFADRGVTWDGTKGLAEALVNYKAANLKAPLWPIGSNDDVYPTSAGPTTDDLNGFLKAAGTYSSLYEFPAQGRPEKLDQLAKLAWKN